MLCNLPIEHEGPCAFDIARPECGGSIGVTTCGGPTSALVAVYFGECDQCGRAPQDEGHALDCPRRGGA